MNWRWKSSGPGEACGGPQESTGAEPVSKRVLRIFWDWQDASEEEWLSVMERCGWRFTERGGAFYTFISVEPNNAIYRIDYRALSDSEADEYFGLFEDAGWEHVESYSSNHYFRCLPEACEFPEVYSDRDSLQDKYRRRVKTMLALVVSYLPIWITIMSRPVPPGKGPFLTGLYTAGKWGYGLLIAMAGYWMLRMYMLIRSV